MQLGKIGCFVATVFENSEKWEPIKNRIVEFSKKSTKEYKSLTSRSLFKHMDILDAIKNN